MNRSILMSALALTALLPAAAQASPYRASPVSYEEELARAESETTLAMPIAGVENNAWFDYQTDLAEARTELKKDLRGVTDAEDERDAWDEYRTELADARHDYVREMKEKGYQTGQVRVYGSAR